MMDNAKQPQSRAARTARRWRMRRGASVLELAILAPALTLMALGTIEVGRKIMVAQIVTNAAREGARRATINLGSDAACNTAVTNYLSSAKINGATVTISPSADASPAGTQISVTVTVPYSSVTWLPGAALYMPNKALVGKVIMRKQ
ncbi:MAG: pilus assembly protein [Planctomycetia bacterium]|nr:pilus assembly protein [Planctomycetia bacterium]